MFPTLTLCGFMVPVYRHFFDKKVVQLDLFTKEGEIKDLQNSLKKFAAENAIRRRPDGLCFRISAVDARTMALECC